MPIFAGVDGGGTRTTVGLADADGREILRIAGSAGLVDPREPLASAATVAALVREAAGQAGVQLPLAGLCAGIAGVNHGATRATVEAALRDSGVATRVSVITDGEIALDGALGEGPGIMLLAGTGSVAHARAPDGRFERCGGWGMYIGDEGSGYDIGRSALVAIVRAADGRGAATGLSTAVMERLDVSEFDALPPWIGRSSKSEVAALATEVVRLAEQGDGVAGEILAGAARELVLHVEALVQRLGPWPGSPRVVLYGGVLRSDYVRELIASALARQAPEATLVPTAGDAVSGALRHARQC